VAAEAGSRPCAVLLLELGLGLGLGRAAVVAAGGGWGRPGKGLSAGGEEEGLAVEGWSGLAGCRCEAAECLMAGPTRPAAGRCCETAAAGWWCGWGPPALGHAWAAVPQALVADLFRGSCSGSAACRRTAGSALTEPCVSQAAWNSSCERIPRRLPG
jgi:hypothetical protein